MTDELQVWHLRPLITCWDLSTNEVIQLQQEYVFLALERRDIDSNKYDFVKI